MHCVDKGKVRKVYLKQSVCRLKYFILSVLLMDHCPEIHCTKKMEKMPDKTED